MDVKIVLASIASWLTIIFVATFVCCKQRRTECITVACCVHTGKNLVTVAHHLSSYIQRDGGLLDRLDRLERLHYVLELVIALEQYALLPTSVLSYAARSVQAL